MTTAFITGTGAGAADEGLMPFTVLAAPAKDIDQFLQGYMAWIQLPPAPAEPMSRLPRLLREARAATGWSQREIADILGTSHTTVRRLERDGQVTVRSREIAAKIPHLHAALVRLARVAGSPEALATALVTPVGETTAADLLRDGNWPRAFTTAIDAIRGPRPEMLGAPPGPPPPDATRELRP
jgi:transcriptional regulator with XRE-family HTH domain